MLKRASIYKRVSSKEQTNLHVTKTVRGVLPNQLNHSKTERQDFLGWIPVIQKDKVNQLIKIIYRKETTKS